MSTLPTFEETVNALGQLMDCLKGRHAQEWWREFKLFLRGETCWVRERNQPKLGESLGLVRDVFAINNSLEAPLRIGHVTQNFFTRFGGLEVFEDQTPLRYKPVSESMLVKDVCDKYLPSSATFGAVFSNLKYNRKLLRHGGLNAFFIEEGVVLLVTRIADSWYLDLVHDVCAVTFGPGVRFFATRFAR